MCVCVCTRLCFRWFRPWPVTGPTPYGNTVSWTRLRCRVAAGNRTPRTKSSKYALHGLKIHIRTQRNYCPFVSIISLSLSFFLTGEEQLQLVFVSKYISALWAEVWLWESHEIGTRRKNICSFLFHRKMEV